MNRNEKLVKILKYKGTAAQILKFCEEAAEAIQAVAKADREKIIEEFADLENLKAQIQIMYTITSKEIRDMQDKKITRQLDRIKKEKDGRNEKR